MSNALAVQRRYFVIATVAVLLGLFLYLFPHTIATLPAPERSANPWPWPIGPLAVRFIASFFIAGALGIYLVSRRPDLPTVTAFLSLTAIVSGLLLVHSIVNVNLIDWSKPVSFLWAGGLALICVGSVLLVRRQRVQMRRSAPSLPPTPQAATWINIVIFILTGLVGGTLFFLPTTGLALWPWNLGNTVNVQLFGALFLAVSLSALWTWRQPSWYGYDLFYPAAGTFATVALLASFIHWDLFADRPLTSWLFVVVYMLGAVMGYYPYLRYSFSKYAQAQRASRMDALTG